MHFNKVITFISIAGILMSCNSGVVSRKQYDALKGEYNELKETKEAIQKDFIEQNEQIGLILDELTIIAGRTSSLRNDVESGKGDIKQAEAIHLSLESIRARIGELEAASEELMAKNKEFKKVVEGLKGVITQQEDQISNLMSVIADKDKMIARQGRTIKEHEGTIAEQNEKITAQNEQLKKTVRAQAKMLFDAGALLEEVADNAPSVSWRKNKEKMANMTQDIYKKALTYYEQAQKAGFAEAEEAIANVRTKIQAE